jgi:hypothetical protein
MAKIHCKDSECRHNCMNHCLQNFIDVSSQAFCHSFDDKSITDNLEEYAEDLLDKDTINIDIRCECVGCAANVHRFCTNEKVEIKHKDYGAKCCSYHSK